MGFMYKYGAPSASRMICGPMGTRWRPSDSREGFLRAAAQRARRGEVEASELALILARERDWDAGAQVER